jgi:hypothetical protein
MPVSVYVVVALDAVVPSLGPEMCVRRGLRTSDELTEMKRWMIKGKESGEQTGGML